MCQKQNSWNRVEHLPTNKQTDRKANKQTNKTSTISLMISNNVILCPGQYSPIHSIQKESIKN